MILLDTRTLLWLIIEPERLSARAKTLISSHCERLAVSAEIALASVALPPHHNDPADRIIIATAAIHGAPVITSDGNFTAYRSVLVES